MDGVRDRPEPVVRLCRLGGRAAGDRWQSRGGYRLPRAGPGDTDRRLAGEFVGRGEMATVAVGESFSVGLRIDSSLRARRKLVDKEERILRWDVTVPAASIGPARFALSYTVQMEYDKQLTLAGGPAAR